MYSVHVTCPQYGKVIESAQLNGAHAHGIVPFAGPAKLQYVGGPMPADASIRSHPPTYVVHFP